MATGNIITVSAWVKYSVASQPGNSSWGYIVSKSQLQATSPFILGVQGNRLAFTSSFDMLAVSGAQNDNQWHLATGVRNGNNVYLYVDGVMVASDTSGTGNANNNELVTIGGDDASPTYRPFQGLIDDVRIYNVALSADEVMHSFAQQEDEWDLGLDDDIVMDNPAPPQLLQSGNMMGVR
jgi:hypothetical protein